MDVDHGEDHACTWLLAVHEQVADGPVDRLCRVHR